MLSRISSYVESGQVSPQIAYLYLLIASGINEKTELSKKTNVTVRSVERNFRALAELGLTYSSDGNYYAQNNEDIAMASEATKMSPDLKDFKKLDKDIYISNTNDNDVEIKKTARQIAKYFNVSPSRVEDAIKRAIGNNAFSSDAAIEACLITKQRIKEGKVRSVVGYFVIVLRNMYNSGLISTNATEESNLEDATPQWNEVKTKIRQHLGKSTFKYIIEPTKAFIDDSGVLLLKTTNREFCDFIAKEYLALIKHYWAGEVTVAV